MVDTRWGRLVCPRARLGVAAACCLAVLGVLAACTADRPGRTGAAAAAPGQVGIPRQEAGLVTRDRYAGHVEPDVAVNPLNPQDLLGACIFEAGPRIQLPGTFASFDGGRTWTDNGLLPLPAGYEMGGDTTAAFDPGGTGYVAALVSHGGGGYPSRISRGGIFLWWTTDGGRSFGPPVPVYAGPGFQDHPWLAYDPSGPASLVIAWTNRSGLEFAVSRDGGTVFSSPRLVVPAALRPTRW
jgi:hypothetical protein